MMSLVNNLDDLKANNFKYFTNSNGFDNSYNNRSLPTYNSYVRVLKALRALKAKGNGPK